MPEIDPLVDVLVRYVPQLPGNLAAAVMHVRRYAAADGDLLVIGEPSDNPGMSVTNAIEHAVPYAEMASGVVREHALVLEYYPGREAPRVGDDDEAPSAWSLDRHEHGSFDVVELSSLGQGPIRWAERTWAAMTRSGVEQLLGGTIETWHERDYTIEALARDREILDLSDLNGRAVRRP
jgi:hypothetical protein